MAQSVSKTLRDQAITFSVADSDVSKLRRMINESGTATYTDATLADYIAIRWQHDDMGRDPVDSSWTATYDLNGAAADLWAEKLAELDGKFDFSADDGSFSRSQLVENAMKMCKHYKARSAPRPLTMVEAESNVKQREYVENVLYNDVD